VVMVPLDIPEVLIAISLLGVVAWAIYNFTHRGLPH
jgi:hypothetical protein